ncbi:hypothetical protein PGT21_020802 [Puccinia graminis f. sp. tritici]|uniref:Uncharacterized protein n=1 Tax=Puccinia graminis f. sp. tritici TaxID=56615 RepID=A0A5B0PPC1_PUCGR|nr:hypothetical protein PGT21_020802 [Puccinia graminis f. sp. tritici]
MLAMVALDDHQGQLYHQPSDPTRQRSSSSLLPLPAYNQPLFGIPDFHEDLLPLPSASNWQDQVHQGSFYHEADDFFKQGPTGALLPLPTSDQPLFGISESLGKEFTNLPSASNWLDMDHDQGRNYHQTSYPAEEGSARSVLPIPTSDEQLPLVISGNLEEEYPTLPSASNWLDTEQQGHPHHDKDNFPNSDQLTASLLTHPSFDHPLPGILDKYFPNLPSASSYFHESVLQENNISQKSSKCFGELGNCSMHVQNSPGLLESFESSPYPKSGNPNQLIDTNLQESSSHPEVVPDHHESQEDENLELVFSIESLSERRADWMEKMEQLRISGSNFFDFWRINTVPERMIDTELLEGHLSKFAEHMRTTSKRVQDLQKNWNTYAMKDYPALRIPLSGTDDFFIRVIGDKRKSTQTRYYQISNFKNIMKSLILINNAVSRQFNPADAEMNEVSSNTQLLNWLFDQSFIPKNSFPVFGTFPKDHNLKPGEEFGLVQKILLDQLSRSKSNEYSFEASILIISLWYIDYNPKLWKNIKNYQEGCSPQISMILFVGRFIFSGINFNQNNEEFKDFHVLGTNIPGNLKEPDLSKFPITMKPERWDKKNFDGSIKSLRELFKIDPSHFDKRVISVEGLPVKLKKFKTKTKQKACKYRIRIDDSVDHLYIKRFIVKVELLGRHLQICHRDLITQLKLRGKKMNEDSFDSFNKWFENILLGKEGGSFPIIGDVESGKDQFDFTDWGEVQSYLIKQYFSDSSGYFKAVWISLALLEYWYKCFQNPEYFFQTDNEYWNIMIKSLGKKMSISGRYSLKNFDEKGFYSPYGFRRRNRFD